MEFRMFSIWSEDIVGARNLAMSMKVNHLNYKHDFVTLWLLKQSFLLTGTCCIHKYTYEFLR